MKVQNSFDNKKTLYIVATPIGNLSEMTPRAIEILNGVDIIACEDTRTSQKLLNYFGIKKKTISHHLHNEKNSCKGIIELLNDGNDVALISDAGYPLYSDPGGFLVNQVIKSNFNVVPVSGANASINALVASGLAVQPYIFFGFLNSNGNKRKQQLETMKEYPFTIVFYESPHRVKDTLEDILNVFGNREIVLARELTKKHETFIRGRVKELIENIDLIKGEIVLIVEGKKEECLSIDEINIKELIDDLVDEGLSIKDSIKKISKDYNLSKNEVYNKYHSEE